MTKDLEIRTDEELNIETCITIEKSPDGVQTPPDVVCCTDENIDSNVITQTSLIEYKEIEEPCVALTIIGENRLSNAGIFIRRGTKFSFKAFFSTLVLTVINMFI